MPRDAERYPLDDRVRIQHMLDAAEHIVSFVEGRSRRDLDNDVMLVRALMNAVQEIGEAAARVSHAGRQRAPDVPWARSSRCVTCWFMCIGAWIVTVSGVPPWKIFPC